MLLFQAALFGAIVTALPALGPDKQAYAIKERLPAPPHWTRTSPADKDGLITLHIGLRQRGEDLVIRHLTEISDPDHARYGQHLSAAEVLDLVRPEADTVELVVAWLAEHGISEEATTFSEAGDWISVDMPISQAEDLLQSSYWTYRHDDGTELSRTEEWSLPAHLHEHIDVIQPTTSFLRMRPRAITWIDDDSIPLDVAPSYTTDVGSVCNVNNTTPDCLRTLYGTLNYTVQAADQNSVAICNYLNETDKRSDVLQFLQAYRPEAADAAYSFPIHIIHNAPNDQGNYTQEEVAAGTNIEGNLDAELVLGISWPTPFEAYSTGGSPPFNPDVNTPTNTHEPYLAFLNHILTRKKLPWVLSTSYGDDEQSVPESYARRVCHGFAQLGARGVSVLFSSGDAGVGSNGTCVSNDGTNSTRFLAAFPASCPWVTTVGGTANFEPETAV
jgi:tripeptidyl-peptidase I